jgi:hypothetical protein
MLGESHAARGDSIRLLLGPTTGIVTMMTTTTAARQSPAPGREDSHRLVKPVKQSELLHAVRRALGLREGGEADEDLEQLDRPA